MAQEQEVPTSGLRLLTSRTQTPAGRVENPSLAVPGRAREARPPGIVGTVRPGQGRDTERRGRDGDRGVKKY